MNTLWYDKDYIPERVIIDKFYISTMIIKPLRKLIFTLLYIFVAPTNLSICCTCIICMIINDSNVDNSICMLNFQ